MKRGRPPKRDKQNLWNRNFLRLLSPEQRRQRKLEMQRDWERRNKKTLRRTREAWLKKIRKECSQAENQTGGASKRQAFRNPLLERAVDLYQDGNPSAVIAKMLHISPGSVRAAVWRAGIKRKFVHHVRNHFLKESTVNWMIVQDYRREAHTLKRLDENRHWCRHPEFVAWREKMKAEKNRILSLKSYRKCSQIRLAKTLAGFKCQFCGCDASAIPAKRRKAGLKYCSVKCQKSARIVAGKLRLQSDPEFKRRRREIAKECYDRTRRERPEIIKAQVRRKLADPLNRIIRNHRMHIRTLVKSEFMIKSQSSIKYLGCTPEFLKAHLESQFRPGMAWDNYGKVWHVDHKFPLRPPKPYALNLKDPNECARVFNWRNLRPMFGKENMSKSNKVVEELVSLSLVVS